MKRVAAGRDDEGVEEDIPFTLFIKKMGRAEDVGDMDAANDASTKSAHTDVPMVAKSSTQLAMLQAVGGPQGRPGPGEAWSVAKAEKDDASDAEAQKLIESAKSAKTLARVMSCADLEAGYVMVEYLDGVDKGSGSKVHAKRLIARMADEDDPLFNAAVSSCPKTNLIPCLSACRHRLTR